MSLIFYQRLVIENIAVLHLDRDYRRGRPGPEHFGKLGMQLQVWMDHMETIPREPTPILSGTHRKRKVLFRP